MLEVFYKDRIKMVALVSQFSCKSTMGLRDITYASLCQQLRAVV